MYDFRFIYPSIESDEHCGENVVGCSEDPSCRVMGPRPVQNFFHENDQRILLEVRTLRSIIGPPRRCLLSGLVFVD